MIRSDFHVHSSFSADSPAKMDVMIESAIAKGLKTLCFTEHHDIDINSAPLVFLLDFETYRKDYLHYKSNYQSQIELLFGIELGIQPHLYTRLTDITKALPYDFVLCSNHVVNGIDPYLPAFFEGKSKEEAYYCYFEDILKNVKAYDDFDSYGHLDYVIRYGHYETKRYLYEEYKEVLDSILTTLISKGKGIEINASGFKYGLQDSHPSYQVIERYRQLGGEIITVGSDAHKPEQIANYFDLCEAILKKAGFKSYTLFRRRKPVFIPFE